jgi:hypothetical protein
VRGGPGAIRIGYEVNTFEYETERFVVLWDGPDGRVYRSTGCSTREEAIARSSRHDWPYVIARETSSRKVVEGSHSAMAKRD